LSSFFKNYTLWHYLAAAVINKLILLDRNNGGMSAAISVRVFLAAVSFSLAVLAFLTSKIREARLEEKEKKVFELGKRLGMLEVERVAEELKIKEYNARILLRKLASRGKIKAKKEGEKEVYYL